LVLSAFAVLPSKRPYQPDYTCKTRAISRSPMASS
jgi:hypothetical protein